MNLLDEARKKRINLGDLVEITLFDGASFNLRSSSIPCAYKPERSTDKTGERVSGYVALISGDANNESSHYLEISPGSGDVNIGGFAIYSPAIHSITKR